MKIFPVLGALMLSVSCAVAESQRLYFANENADGSKRIALTIEGSEVYGSQVWQPAGETHGSRGILKGSIDSDGLIKVVHEYTMEGSEQSEEERLKLSGDTLYIGEGELVERDGKLALKDPKKVTFKTALKKVEFTEPAAGSPERKAVMDAMRGPVSKRVGHPVTFTGDVRIFKEWARFEGDVATADGKPAKDEAAAAELELDFFALLKLNKDGSWRVVSSGFAGDVGAIEEAREKYRKAPWVLFE